MNKREILHEKESLLVSLLARMEKSDAHALKCAKLGLSFSETYPTEAEEYAAIREEYNAVEEEIEALRREIEEEEQRNADVTPIEEGGEA